MWWLTVKNGIHHFKVTCSFFLWRGRIYVEPKGKSTLTIVQHNQTAALSDLAIVPSDLWSSDSICQRGWDLEPRRRADQPDARTGEPPWDQRSKRQRRKRGKKTLIAFKSTESSTIIQSFSRLWLLSVRLSRGREEDDDLLYISTSNNKITSLPRRSGRKGPCRRKYVHFSRSTRTSILLTPGGHLELVGKSGLRGGGGYMSSGWGWGWGADVSKKRQSWVTFW